MNPMFRFDLADTCIYFLSEEGELSCSFNEMLQQINLLTTNPSILDGLLQNAKERFKKQGNEIKMQTAIQSLKDTGYKGAFFSLLYQSFHQYAVEYNQLYMKAPTLKKPDTYFIETITPEYQWLETLLAAFSDTEPAFSPLALPSLSAIHAEVHSGDTYYCSEFSVNTFLFMFRDVLLSMHLSILVCPVCGELFCGTKDSDCCGSAECRQYLATARPNQKKDELSQISARFSNRVRKHRSDLRELCSSAEAVIEFDTYADPKQKYVVEKVKELRRTDAPVKDVLRLKKEVKHIYEEMNEVKKRIAAQYGTAI